MGRFMMPAAISEAIPPDDLQNGVLDAKATAVLIEKLTLAGHTVHADKSGGYTVARWAMSRHCMDFESLREFAKQLGVH